MVMSSAAASRSGTAGAAVSPATGGQAGGAEGCWYPVPGETGRCGNPPGAPETGCPETGAPETGGAEYGVPETGGDETGGTGGADTAGGA